MNKKTRKETRSPAPAIASPRESLPERTLEAENRRRKVSLLAESADQEISGRLSECLRDRFP
jgi:hypothetical protein